MTDDQEEIKIDSNVARPHGYAPGKHLKLFNRMVKGDSVLFDERKKAYSFANAMSNKFGKGMLMCRKVDDGYRVWRLM